MTTTATARIWRPMTATVIDGGAGQGDQPVPPASWPAVFFEPADEAGILTLQPGLQLRKPALF
jgi:hypothetical protein